MIDEVGCVCMRACVCAARAVRFSSLVVQLPGISSIFHTQLRRLRAEPRVDFRRRRTCGGAFYCMSTTCPSSENRSGVFIIVRITALRIGLRGRAARVSGLVVTDKIVSMTAPYGSGLAAFEAVMCTTRERFRPDGSSV
jgi:hypothetical protein